MLNQYSCSSFLKLSDSQNSAEKSLTNQWRAPEAFYCSFNYCGCWNLFQLLDYWLQTNRSQKYKRRNNMTLNMFFIKSSIWCFVKSCYCFPYLPFLFLNFLIFSLPSYGLPPSASPFFWLFLVSLVFSSLVGFLSFLPHSSFSFLFLFLFFGLILSRGRGGVRVRGAPRGRADPATWRSHQERAVHRGGRLDGGRPQREKGALPRQLCEGENSEGGEVYLHFRVWLFYHAACITWDTDLWRS